MAVLNSNVPVQVPHEITVLKLVFWFHSISKELICTTMKTAGIFIVVFVHFSCILILASSAYELLFLNSFLV